MQAVSAWAGLRSATWLDIPWDRNGLEISSPQVRGLILTTEAGQSLRQFVATHPWITFELNLTRLDHVTWMRLGEAMSKCDHIAGVPLLPEVAERLHRVYLVKGVHATTQIEGNTLTEEEVDQRIRGELVLPESQEYLGREIDNVLEACNQIARDLANGQGAVLTPDRISQFNALVLRDLDPLPEGVVPGRTRTRSVVVGNVYRGAPAEDCDYLLEQLCAWIQELRTTTPDSMRIPVAILSAIVAHLYLAWIHPYDDGNGRTARLVEFLLLLDAGVPTPASHVLSNYYNRTRTRYYDVLAQTSRPPYPVEAFIAYAVTGFTEELRQQLHFIREQQLEVAWINFVHEVFRDRDTASCRRQRELVLRLPKDAYTPPARIRRQTPELAELYLGRQQKTVSRDVNRLAELDLIERTAAGVRPRTERVAAFLPMRAGTGEDFAM